MPRPLRPRPFGPALFTGRRRGPPCLLREAAVLRSAWQCACPAGWSILLAIHVISRTSALAAFTAPGAARRARLAISSSRVTRSVQRCRPNMRGTRPIKFVAANAPSKPVNGWQNRGPAPQATGKIAPHEKDEMVATVSGPRRTVGETAGTCVSFTDDSRHQHAATRTCSRRTIANAYPCTSAKSVSWGRWVQRRSPNEGPKRASAASSCPHGGGGSQVSM